MKRLLRSIDTTELKNLNRMRWELMRDLAFWAGYCYGDVCHDLKFDEEYDRARRMNEEIFQIMLDEWDMLRFYVRHVVYTFMPNASMRDNWYYTYRKARQCMREPGGPNDNEMVRKLVWLCCYPH